MGGSLFFNRIVFVCGLLTADVHAKDCIADLEALANFESHFTVFRQNEGDSFVSLPLADLFSDAEVQELWHSPGPPDIQLADLSASRVKTKLEGLIAWIRAAADHALNASGRLQVVEAELRRWTAARPVKNTGISMWHKDLPLLNGTLALLGEGTRVRSKATGDFSVPTKTLILFSGMRHSFERAVIHASPTDSRQDRLVLILSFDLDAEPVVRSP